MSGLNENHKRKILATVQHADELLAQTLNLLAPEPGAVLPRRVADLSRAQAQRVKNSVARIRARIARMLEHMQIDVPPAAARASWLMRTNLTMLDITLEDLYPEKMAGCGELDAADARDMTRTLEEIRSLVAELIAFVDRI